MLQVNGFFGHIRRNDAMSVLMFVGFLVAVQLMVAVVLSIPLAVLDTKHSIFQPIGYLTRYAPFVLIASVAAFWILFKGHVNKVREQLGFRYLTDGEDRRLNTIVETLAITAGIETPKVGVIETPARNAFACGMDSKSAVVVVTRGLLNALTKDELEAVIAHEITHIVNGDIRLIAAANVMLDGLEWLAKKNPFKQPPWWAWLLIPFWSFLFLFKLLGNVNKFALDLGKVSRLLIASSREYIADAEAVRLTHKPEALISALRKIENLSALKGLQPENDAMMIDGATHGDYATHPTIHERIAVLARHASVPVEPPKPISQSAPQSPNPVMRTWQQFNRYLDEQDAKEQAKIDASPAGKIQNLFERVQTVKQRTIWESSRRYSADGWLGCILILSIFVSWQNRLSADDTSLIADKQVDGTYMRNGVKLTADEFEEMAGDIIHFNRAPEYFSPSILKSQVNLQTIDPSKLGLRGRSFDENEGDL